MNSSSRGNIAVVVIIVVVVLGAIWFFARTPSEDTTPTPAISEKSPTPLTGVDSIKKTGSADDQLDANIGVIDNELINLNADASSAIK